MTDLSRHDGFISLLQYRHTVNIFFNIFFKIYFLITFYAEPPQNVRCPAGKIRRPVLRQVWSVFRITPPLLHLDIVCSILDIHSPCLRRWPFLVRYWIFIVRSRASLISRSPTFWFPPLSFAVGHSTFDIGYSQSRPSQSPALLYPASCILPF
jgi:hypothetical protein